MLRDIEPLLTRPVGRPSNAPVVWYAGFLYQAQSWDRARRVVAKVEWHNGELFPRVGFIVTNLVRPAKRVVRFYNQRGTAEQWIKEGKNAVKWTRLAKFTFLVVCVEQGAGVTRLMGRRTVMLLNRSIFSSVCAELQPTLVQLRKF